MKYKIILAAVTAAAFGSPALAADGPPEVYGGVQTGFDHVGVNPIGGKNGLVYGGFVGVQRTLSDMFVFGVEGEVDGATTRQSTTDLYRADEFGEVKAGRDLSVSARMGYKSSPSLLYYVKAGYTNARVTGTYDNGLGDSESLSTNLNGYRLGAGFEIGSGKLRFRSEYRYSGYGDYRLYGVNTGISTHRHQVLVGALYAF